MIYPQKFGIVPDVIAAYDIMTEAHICRMLVNRFGRAILYGTILAKDKPTEDGHCVITCAEDQLRKYLKNTEHVVEIGTKYGVGTLLPAHYAHHATTIDIIPRTEPIAVWNYFGVDKKINYVVVENNEEKAELLNGLDFDFAIIDGDHTYEGVKSDFERVKKCGRVLFHEYILTPPKNHLDKFEATIRFLGELPQDEVTLDEPFAYWERKDGNSV